CASGLGRLRRISITSNQRRSRELSAGKSGTALSTWHRQTRVSLTLNPGYECGALPAARPRLLPLQKFLEQLIGICRRNHAALGASLRRRELPEIRLQARHIRVASRREPLLRRV